MIQYQEFPPSVPLLPFVECLWFLKSHSNFFKERELIIPGGRTEMIFNLGSPAVWIDSKDPSGGRSFIGSYILGPRNRPFFVEQNGFIQMFGVRFRHGGLSPFIPLPMSLLINEVVPTDQVLGNEIDELTSRLCESDAEASCINLIKIFLEKRIRNEVDSRQALRLISWVKESESLPLNALSEKTGVHYKKLERIFSQYTGYNPKNFTRVIRFYRALQQMKAKPLSLTGIGLNGGYYDQPHFIRDFKAFTGKSPSQFSIENPTIANLLLQSKHV
ncbi:MAG TPA: helix-turn-helix domain-containing protein [Chryseolinea sp.]